MKFTKFPKISYLVFPVREDIFFVKCSLFLSKLKLIYIISDVFFILLNSHFVQCFSKLSEYYFETNYF
jgi:hypothetical protein